MSLPEFRIAKEGRPWVVRKRRPGTSLWLPVWYAASKEAAATYVMKQHKENDDDN